MWCAEWHWEKQGIMAFRNVMLVDGQLNSSVTWQGASLKARKQKSSKVGISGKNCSEVEISREKGSEVEISGEKCAEVEISRDK